MAEPEKKALRVHPDDARRAHNLAIGNRLVEAGIPVFVTYDKRPLVPSWQRLDVAMTDDDREAIRQRRKAEGKTTPELIGSTLTLARWKRMHRLAHQDGTASICCGLAKIVVIDADIKGERNGPALLTEYLNEHGGIPEGVVVLPSQSGASHFVFADREGKHRNTEGGLSHLGCNVRGTSGQIVAPGSWRADGKRYGTLDDLTNLIDAITLDSLPELPECLSDLIGKPQEGSLNDKSDRHSELFAELRADEWPDYAGTFGPGARFDVDKLRARSERFAHWIDEPSDDKSDNRFAVASHLKGADARIGVREFATFCLEHSDACGEYVDGTPEPGEFNDRNLVRDFARAGAAVVHSAGDAFGAVDDEEPDAKKPDRQKVLFFEEIRTGELKPLVWIVKNFLAKHTTYITAGTWGTGKTAVIMDVALHAACGLEWQGCRVQKAAVIYVALENPFDVERRVRAWSASMEADGQSIDDAAFVLHRGPCCLYDPNKKGSKDERALIKLAAETEKRYGVPVGLIVVDTVSQALLPGNDREHAGLFVDSIQRIADQTGAAVMALHHPTKAGDPVRGGGEFQGNTDCVMIVERDKSGRGVLRATSKFRIGDPNKARFGYRLRPYVIGKDEDGDDITVVLAVADKSHPALAAVEDEDDDIPAIRVADRREDRVAMLCDVAKEEAARGAAQDEPLTEVKVTLSALVAGMNGRRSNLCGLDGKPLAPLHKKEVTRVVHSAVEAKRLTSWNRGYYWTDLDGDKVGDT